MAIPHYHVDSFTRELFRGTPAGIRILSAFLAESVMQKIAARTGTARPLLLFLAQTSANAAIGGMFTGTSSVFRPTSCCDGSPLSWPHNRQNFGPLPGGGYRAPSACHANQPAANTLESSKRWPFVPPASRLTC